MAEPDRLASLVLQHAQTSRLLGVDFVPAFRRSGRGPVAPVELPAPRADSARVQGSPHAQSAAGAGASPEVGPGAPRDRAEVQARLDALRERYEREAPHQHFVTDHHCIVWGDGNPCARLMFVGEAPGAEEDRVGRPFVGRAGQLLDKMIAGMGLRREEVYIANVLKTRPPDNATPSSEEIRLCAPYLFEQIGIIAPEVIVALGLPASRALLDSVESMSRLRGRWHEFRPPGGFGARTIPVMPTYHPAFLLRSYTEENRRKVWSDLQLVMERLGLKRASPATAQPA